MRLLIFELRPLALEKTGLAAALQARLDGVEVRGGIQANLTVVGEERLSPRVQAELYHIAQEALNNVLKHAHAQHVRVALEFQAAETVLEITDDGQGFVPDQAHEGGGLGLRGMQERVQKLGAGLSIASEPGHGTKITVRVPVSNHTNRGLE
jgi:signal transduction histidine kinase